MNVKLIPDYLHRQCEDHTTYILKANLFLPFKLTKMLKLIFDYDTLNGLAYLSDIRSVHTHTHI